MKCTQCGKEFEGNFCPECGTKAEPEALNMSSPFTPQATPMPTPQTDVYSYQTPAPTKTKKTKKEKKKKPFFLRWWFILLVIIAILIIGGKIGNNDKPSEAPKYSEVDYDEIYAEVEAEYKAILAEAEAEYEEILAETEAALESMTNDTSDIADIAEDETETEVIADTVEPEYEPAIEESVTDNGSDMRPDFIEAMDSYEAFMDEYIDFLEKYAESDGSDLRLLADYATFMAKFAEFCHDFEAWEDEDMTDAEALYYLEVQSRVSLKLLEANY